MPVTDTGTWLTELKSLRPCSDALKFASQFQSLQEAWEACERGDWMLWLVGKRIHCAPWSDGRKPLLACALDCAETVKHLWPKQSSEQIAGATTILRQWISGSTDLGAAKAARKQLGAASAAESSYAAYAAAAAAASAAESSYAAYAAASAAESSYAAYAAAARRTQLKLCAEIVRKHYPTAP